MLASERSSSVPPQRDLKRLVGVKSKVVRTCASQGKSIVAELNILMGVLKVSLHGRSSWTIYTNIYPYHRSHAYNLRIPSCLLQRQTLQSLPRNANGISQDHPMNNLQRLRKRRTRKRLQKLLLPLLLLQLRLQLNSRAEHLEVAGQETRKTENSPRTLILTISGIVTF